MKNFMDYLIDCCIEGIDWCVWVLLLMSETLRPMPVVKLWHGGYNLLPDAQILKFQPALIPHLGSGGDKKALILQTLHGWQQFNIKKNNNLFKGHHWTYGSHDFWHDRHFDWFGAEWFGKLCVQLEKSGFLFSTTKAPFCHKGQKAYRLNYDKIESITGYDKVQEGVVESATHPITNSQEGLHKVPDNNSSKAITKTKSVKQKATATKTRAQESENSNFLKSLGGAFAGGAGNEKQDHDSGILETGKTEAIADETAELESVDFVSGLIRHYPRLAQTDAKNLVKQYGENRVEVVVEYAKKAKGLTNPVGFIINELKNNTKKLGDTLQPEIDRSRLVDNGWASGEYADIIKS